MSQFHKPRETDYYLRVPTELVVFQEPVFPWRDKNLSEKGKGKARGRAGAALDGSVALPGSEAGAPGSPHPAPRPSLCLPACQALLGSTCWAGGLAAPVPGEQGCFPKPKFSRLATGREQWGQRGRGPRRPPSSLCLLASLMPAGFGAAGISPQGESEFGSTKDLSLTNSEQSQFPGALLLGKESQARLIRATAKGRCTGATVSLAGGWRCATLQLHSTTGKAPKKAQSKRERAPKPGLLSPAAVSQSPRRKESPATRPWHIINSSIKKKKKNQIEVNCCWALNQKPS